MEKSLQRIQNGQRNSMYTSQQSVENKVGGVPGWQALLTAVGFRLDSAGPGIPAAVFFPTADPGDRLQQCSTTLQSLLGMYMRQALHHSFIRVRTSFTILSSVLRIWWSCVLRDFVDIVFHIQTKPVMSFVFVAFHIPPCSSV